MKRLIIKIREEAMSRKNISIAVAAILVIAGGLAAWRLKMTTVRAAKRESAILRQLTVDDIKLLIKSQASYDSEKAGNIVRSTESRKAFVKGLKEYLSLAARARREGLTEDNDSRLNLQIKENGLLAELYLSKQKKQNPSFKISDDQIKSFWSNSDNEKQFKAEMLALYAVQDAAAELMGSTLGRQPEPQGEGLQKARREWAKARLLSDMARADAAFFGQHDVQLRLQILEAGVLSTAYLAKYWKERIKATDMDMAVYLKGHPEWDLTKKRLKAEQVLRRALAGEDFVSLAKEFSEDRATRDKGGFYDSYEVGVGLWKEVEDAALKLQPGQIADKLVETKDGYHIVQLVDRTVVKRDDGTEAVYVSLRHILLQRRFEDPTVNRAATPLPPPFKTPEEIAKVAIEKEKRQRFVDEIVRAENISVPDDIEVDAGINALLQQK